MGSGVYLLLASLRVFVPLVATVDDNVAGLHVRREPRDSSVHWSARLHEDDDCAGLLQGGDKLTHVLEAGQVLQPLLLGACHLRVSGVELKV